MSDTHSHDVGPGETALYPDLAGKVAVVTGGSRGIGAATATALAANGVAVVVVGRDEAALAGVIAAIGEQGGRSIKVAADCTRATHAAGGIAVADGVVVVDSS